MNSFVQGDGLRSVLRVDLNADVGESFGAWTLGADERLFRSLSSANIACGWHAGDPGVMEKTVRLALRTGVSIGAHPGYPDLAGFGRRSMALSPEEIRQGILYQTGALWAFVKAAGGRLVHVKAHGALYNDGARSAPVARAIARAVAVLDPSLILVGLSGSELEKAAREEGLVFAAEFFADRGYRDDGSLVPRSEPGALVHDEDLCIERVLRAVQEGTVVSVSGKVVPVRCDTICLHGDNPEAVVFAESLKAALAGQGIQVAAPALSGQVAAPESSARVPEGEAGKSGGQM